MTSVGLFSPRKKLSCLLFCEKIVEECTSKFQINVSLERVILLFKFHVEKGTFISKKALSRDNIGGLCCSGCRNA